MNVSIDSLQRASPPEIATTLRNAGLAGAGGAGFPTYAKWKRLDEVPYLMVNHQESEPNYVMDKWLGRTCAEEFAEFFDALLDSTFETVVIAAKAKDREEWMGELEVATDPTVYGPEDLPLDPTTESGVVVAYTEDRYQYGMETVLMRMVADVMMRDELPMDHGWIVQNTETLYNVMRTLEDGEPFTRKLVHVDGNVPEHRFLAVPVGTPAADLLGAAGRSLADLEDDEVLADGGPGWCFRVDADPEDFGVRKRTNCLLVLDEAEVEANTLGNGRINLLSARDWDPDVASEPTELSPDRVRIPRRTNPDLAHVVDRSQPIVGAGEAVEAGEMIATPASDGICSIQHATIDGEVVAIEPTHVEIRATSAGAGATGRERDHGKMVYWTWCADCGAYVARPEFEHVGEGIHYVCRDCR